MPENFVQCTEELLFCDFCNRKKVEDFFKIGAKVTKGSKMLLQLK
jgi:hypothetical protein